MTREGLFVPLATIVALVSILLALRTPSRTAFWIVRVLKLAYGVVIVAAAIAVLVFLAGCTWVAVMGI